MGTLNLLTFLLQFWVTISQTLDSPHLLDLMITNYAMGSYRHNHTRTGIPHSVHLPANLSGIKLQTARFRCGSLTRHGAANLSAFHLPIGLRIPRCVKRVVIVAQELDPNWSSIYARAYNLSGYQLVSPILGLLAYKGEVGNLSELELVSGKTPIKVDFGKKNPGMVWFCASFEDDGRVVLREERGEGVCVTAKKGHFGVVMELPEQPREAMRLREKVSERKAAAVLSVGGVICAVLMALLLVAMFVKVKRNLRLGEMERRAYEEEAMRVSMVGHVRPPPTRTMPVMVIEQLCNSIRPRTPSRVEMD